MVEQPVMHTPHINKTGMTGRSLGQLVRYMDARVVGTRDFSSEQMIAEISCDSREQLSDYLFCAFPGLVSDGRDYMQAAVDHGAIAIFAEFEDYSARFSAKSETLQVPVFLVEGLVQKLSDLARFFYHEPDKQLQLVGVTGTNGKTTVAYLLSQALSALGKRCAYSGTIGFGDVIDLNESVMTTQDAVKTQRQFRSFANAGYQAACIEVSSHALDQGRVSAVPFDVAVFTNLTQDHLDYHGDMASYGAAKLKLFADHQVRLSVVNTDSDYAPMVLKADRAKSRITFGHDNADLQLRVLSQQLSGSDFTISWQGQKYHFKTQLIGRFNAENILAVIASLLGLGFAMQDIQYISDSLTAPPGRMESLGGGALPLVVVDYAHTPDALNKALIALTEIVEGQLWVCFGCGGDRDRTKRAEMGAVAERYADQVILTDDNPRTEAPEQIVADIKSGMSRTPCVEHDRRQAIFNAINSAQAGDVILIAGKGHEQMQDYGSYKVAFDDVTCVQECLKVAA